MGTEEFEYNIEERENSLHNMVSTLIEKYEGMPADEFVEHFEAVLEQGSFFARRQL